MVLIIKKNSHIDGNYNKKMDCKTPGAFLLTLKFAKMKAEIENTKGIFLHNGKALFCLYRSHDTFISRDWISSGGMKSGRHTQRE